MDKSKNSTLTPAQQAAKDYSDRMRTEMKGQSNGIALYEAFLAGVTYAQQHMTVTIKASDLLHGRRIAHVRPVPTSESKL